MGVSSMSLNNKKQTQETRHKTHNAKEDTIMAVTTFGFDEGKDIKDNSLPRFKGETGKTYIFGYAWDVPSEIFRMAEGHYSQAAKKGWQCLSNPEKGTKEICCTYDYEGNEPKKKVGCAIVLYKTNEDQQITGIGEVLPWTFSPKTFQSLRKIYLEHGLVDIVATCSDSKFQNFTFVPKKTCAWIAKEEIKQHVKSKAVKVYEAIPKMMYTKMSLSEIKEHLGIASSGDSDASTGLSLDSIANSLQE